MNQAELNAYGQMAQALVGHADDWIKSWEFKLPGVSEPVYHHLSDSAFEGVADRLWRLKIFRALDDGANFVFDCERHEAYSVAIANSELGPSFDELLYTVAYLFGDYGSEYWGFSTEQGVPFGVGGRLSPMFDALVKVGYVEKSEAGYVWTRRVAPIMRAAGYESKWPP